MAVVRRAVYVAGQARIPVTRKQDRTLEAMGKFQAEHETEYGSITPRLCRLQMC